MDVNKKEAHKNFGNSADNMSAVVCTIYPSSVWSVQTYIYECEHREKDYLSLFYDFFSSLEEWEKERENERERERVGDLQWTNTQISKWGKEIKKKKII